MIRELLSAERPDDGLVGEEGSRIEGEHGRRWIVDPLDGTVNFLYGLRAWAREHRAGGRRGARGGRGVQPRERGVLRAERGEGATMNGRPIHVTDCRSLDRAMVATGFSYEAEQPRRAGRAAGASCCPRIRDLRRAGAAALDLAYVAAGRVDAFYERGLKRVGRGGRPPAGRRGGRRDRGPGRRAARRGGGGDAGAARGASSVRGLGLAFSSAAAALQQVVDQRLDLLVGQAALEGGHRVAEARDDEGLRLRRSTRGRTPRRTCPARASPAAVCELVQVRADRAVRAGRGERVAAGAAGRGEDLLAGLGLCEAGRGERALVVAGLRRPRRPRRPPRRLRPRP